MSQMTLSSTEYSYLNSSYLNDKVLENEPQSEDSDPKLLKEEDLEELIKITSLEEDLNEDPKENSDADIEGDLEQNSEEDHEDLEEEPLPLEL